MLKNLTIIFNAYFSQQSLIKVLKNLKNPYECSFTPDDISKTIIRLIKRKNLLKKKFINL